MSRLKRALKQRYNFENIVGKSEPMLRIFDLVAQVAPTRSTCLIQGESGTGKELIARAIHSNSPRKEAPCAREYGRLPTELLESTTLRPYPGVVHGRGLGQEGAG